jgi:hypothetical protein
MDSLARFRIFQVTINVHAFMEHTYKVNAITERQIYDQVMSVVVDSYRGF